MHCALDTAARGTERIVLQPLLRRMDALPRETLMTLEYGGKSVYGACVGILMLEARFPRIEGDMGNAGTWPFPVLYRVVRGATPEKVVRENAEGLLEKFIDAAVDLVEHGADCITTNCGFLSLFQKEIKEAAGVPVATSALMQAPMIKSILPPGRQVGILTISKSTLTDDHLLAAGVPLDTPVAGTDGGREFTEKLLGDCLEVDFDLCREDMRDAALELVADNESVGAVLLECTNMVPYADDIRRLTGLPVYSIYTLVGWLQAASMPRRFRRELGDPRRNP